MNTALKFEYWWLIIPCAIIFAWILSKKNKPSNMTKPGMEQAASVHYSSDGRSGKVHYVSKEGSFDMYYEFGGGDVIAIINVPTEARWEEATKIPLEKRMAVLNFIGQKTVEKQTTGGKGKFEISDNAILIKS